MKQIFVFTAGDLDARKHLDDSINTAVPAALLDEHLPLEEAAYYKEHLPAPEGFYAWGAVPGIQNQPRWESMKSGDIVLTVYENHYRYVSTVIGRFQNPGLAKRIWGTDSEGKTWEYMYVLSKPIAIKIPVQSSPAANFLNNGYRGFTRISDEKLAVIRATFGDLSQFVQAIFQSTLPPTTVQTEIINAENQLEQEKFDPKNIIDARKKVLAEIIRRRGQKKFRQSVLEAYGGCCAITGCKVESVLEAAHIISYAGGETNHVTNGILLRADIHTLFDLGEIRIDHQGFISIDEKLEDSTYSQYAGKKIKSPKDPSKAPHPEALSKKHGQSM